MPNHAVLILLHTRSKTIIMPKNVGSFVKIIYSFFATKKSELKKNSFNTKQPRIIVVVFCQIIQMSNLRRNLLRLAKWLLIGEHLAEKEVSSNKYDAMNIINDFRVFEFLKYYQTVHNNTQNTICSEDLNTELVGFRYHM